MFKTFSLISAVFVVLNLNHVVLARVNMTYHKSNFLVYDPHVPTVLIFSGVLFPQEMISNYFKYLRKQKNKF